MVKGILAHGLGTVIGCALAFGLVFLIVSDVMQKNHGVLRNCRVIGYLRYWIAQLGEYIEQYFFARERDEMLFNCATRAWVFRLVKNESGVIGFGSADNLHQASALVFVNHSFAVSQGAKPGKAGVSPGRKVTERITRICGIAQGRDWIGPNWHHGIASISELLDRVALLRALTECPAGVNTALGGWHFMNDLCEAVHCKGFEFVPEFLVIDGGEGGSGAAPQVLADHMGLSIDEGLLHALNALVEAAGLRQRIRVVTLGKPVTSACAAWALCVGANLVITARGLMFALSCIQALRCHSNTYPTGVTTPQKHRQRWLVVEEKYLRVARYVNNMNRETDMIIHACGLRHARELGQEHARTV